jgi:two-component system response regulator PilR (NtrC family)
VTKKEFKILIADNDRLIQDVMRSLLLKEGYVVVLANDGFDALKILKTENISLVITALKMSGANGIEILKYALRINPDTAVVILTTFGNLESTLEAVKEGAYDYLTKPFKAEEISFLVEKAYKRSILINENKELLQYLRDTYQDMEVIKTTAQSNNPEITLGMIERMERLKTMNVLTSQDVEILKERLVKGV